MTITESRVRRGVLTFTNGGSAVDFSCQPTNVHVTPSYDDDGDRIETLCGDVIPPGKIESYIIGGTSVQDFDDPEGFLAFCYAHATESAQFQWVPNIEGAPTWSGTVTIVALEEGGDINTRITTDWEFEVHGRPGRIYGQSLSAEAQAEQTGLSSPAEGTQPQPAQQSA